MKKHHVWNTVGVNNPDGSISTADPFGNEIKFRSGEINGFEIIEGGFTNPLDLQFIDGDGLEFVIMREMENDYSINGLNQDSLVIDIGAHVGVVSMTIAKKYKCRVEAYEPAPNNYRRLVANISANHLEALITPYNLAVTADGRDVAIGGAGAESSGGMTIYRWLYPRPGTPFTSVLSIALKDIIRDRTIDLLKIDCEGAEHEIFEDLSPLRNVRAIRGEFHNISKSGHLFSAKDLFERVKSVVDNTIVQL